DTEIERRVREDKPRRMIHEPDCTNDLIERKEENDRRKESHHEQSGRDQRTNLSSHSCQAIRRKRTARQANDRRKRSNHSAVQAVGKECAPAEQFGVVASS